MEVLISKEQIGLKLVEIIRDHMLEFLVFQYVLLPIAQYMLAQIKYYLLAPMRLRLGFLLDYNRNMENLTTQLGELREIWHEVQDQVYAAAASNEEFILPRVRKWLESADEITEDVMNFIDNELHLNPMVRCQRSKYAKEKTAEADELIRKGWSFNRVSTISIFEDIMRLLKYGDTNRIGIFGEGGVGKTFLANEIYEEAKDGDRFEEVVMATVSSHPYLGRIQYEIADMLGLRFDEMSTAGRARRLSKIFDGKKRILIILDDIHENFKLEDVGIRLRQRFKGCKIVLVSRSQAVCNQLGTEIDFTIRFH